MCIVFLLDKRPFMDPSNTIEGQKAVGSQRAAIAGHTVGESLLSDTGFINQRLTSLSLLAVDAGAVNQEH